MKFCNSKVLANLAMFDHQNLNAVNIGNPVKSLMRGLVDMFLIWKTIEYFKPNSLLEIGSYTGQTLGIMLESAGHDANITSVDINLSRLSVFQHLFPDNQIEFIKIDSLDLQMQRTYDFIHVDGNHKNPWVINDIQKSLEMSHDYTIISLDDYEKTDCDVDIAIKDYLLGQNNFVPFLIGDSSIFFHHVSHDASDFLDHWLQKDSENFLTFCNENFYNDFRVLKTCFISQRILSSNMPNLFNDSLNLFKNALKFYNL